MAKADCGFSDIPGGATGAALLVFNGPTILVDVGFDASFDADSGLIPKPGITSVRALVDTGAAESCIDSMLATQLGLPKVDRRHVSGSSGRHEVDIYLAQMRVPSLGFIEYGFFAGLHLSEGGQGHRALIGRTFLQYFSLTYEGRTGKVSISSK